MIAADERANARGQGLSSQRPGCDDDRLALTRRRDRQDFFTPNRDERMPRQLSRDDFRKAVAVNRQRGAGGDAARFSGAEHQRPEASHLLLEEPDSVVEFVAAE